MAAGVNYCGPAKTSHKGFCLATLEKLMKYLLGGSYLFMNSTLIVPSGRQILTIRYKYNYRKVQLFISTEGTGSTESVDPNLSSFSDVYSNVSV